MTHSDWPTVTATADDDDDDARVSFFQMMKVTANLTCDVCYCNRECSLHT